jgi:hypothetical protein
VRFQGRVLNSVGFRVLKPRDRCRVLIGEVADNLEITDWQAAMALMDCKT